MPLVQYAQLAVKADKEDEVKPVQNNSKCFDLCLQKTVLSLALILLYFSLSIGLTFYQRWLLKDFSYPLTVVMYHLVIKWLLSVVIRTILYYITGEKQLRLPLLTCVRAVAPTGLASGIDVGFSNWGLELVTISLYTMTKSTTIIFILGFAIILGLERKSWSLVGIVFMIATGLIMFTYKATQFNLKGFNFLLLASFSAGLRWTFAQLLMQKSKLGLHNPIDMVFHVQPWMFLSLLPFMALFEGLNCFHYLMASPEVEFVPTMLKVSVGATIAFAMELSEFLVVTYTSSLTLSVAGIFKEMCILVLAVKVSGDQLSVINVAGLVVCLFGIAGHIIHKMFIIRSIANMAPTKENILVEDKKDDGQPLLLLNDAAKWTESEDSDNVGDEVLFEVLQRRDPFAQST